MQKARIWALAAVVGIASACTGDLPVVGIDPTGKIVEKMVSGKIFEKFLKKSLTDMQDTVIPVVDEQQAERVRAWALRKVLLGLGLKGSIGFFDIVKLGGSIGFRLVFTNIDSK